jgi:flagellar protein FlaG
MGIQQLNGQAAAYVPQRPAQRSAPASEPRPVGGGLEAAPERPTPPQTQPLSSQVSQQELEAAVAKIKEAIKPLNSNSLEFSIDDSTGRTIVRIVDSATKEVVRQIPSEEMLAIVRSIKSDSKGLLVQSNA